MEKRCRTGRNFSCSQLRFLVYLRLALSLLSRCVYIYVCVCVCLLCSSIYNPILFISAQVRNGLAWLQISLVIAI